MGNKVFEGVDRLHYACITDIERYAVHDGPGIRTVVFFKGCPLRCLWCQNPETNNVCPEIIFTTDSCIACMGCKTVCPEHAIEVTDSGFAFDCARCSMCGKCIDECPTMARELSGEMKSLEEVVDSVLSDREFYKNTNGGVTVSGGEATMQADFVSNLLRIIKANGINTAMETCGYCSTQDFAKAIEYCDLLLFDIKHTDPEVHKKYTGVGTDLIMKNLKYAKDKGKNIIIRIPLIPDVNSDDKNLKRTGEIARECGASEIHILPFHQAGEKKWDSLDREYECRQWQAPGDDLILHAKEILQQSGSIVNVGGSGEYVGLSKDV